jgi:predicted nicotinamide N-methyase
MTERHAGDLIEEVVLMRDRELAVLRPRDSEALIDEEAFERDEQMPYWAELWPSGIALARAVSGAALGGRSVLEIGCGGLALPSITAALGGARVLATDWAPEALTLAAANAERNGAPMEVAEVRWDSPEELLTRAPFDLVLGADVLYEHRNVDDLIGLLPRLGREIWLADPHRAAAEAFFEAADEQWTHTEIVDPVVPTVVIHRLSLRRG